LFNPNGLGTGTLVLSETHPVLEVSTTMASVNTLIASTIAIDYKQDSEACGESGDYPCAHDRLEEIADTHPDATAFISRHQPSSKQRGFRERLYVASAVDGRS